MIEADTKLDYPLKQDLFLKVRAYVQFFRKKAKIGKIVENLVKNLKKLKIF